MIYRIAIITTLIFFCSSLAAQEPQWQLGAGFGAVDFRLYPGSRESKTYVFPVPYFTYTSSILEISHGIRGLLPSNTDWYVDFSADFGLPVNSDDSLVRAGMPDLDATLQIGPSLEYTITGSRTGAQEFRLELPLRTAISIDVDHQGNEGWIFEPRLVFEKRRIGRSGLYARAKAGLRYATQDYHAYYYDVDQAYVTPQRSLFESETGYSGLIINLHTTWRQNDVLFWGILRYENLNHSAIENSPLVEDKDYYFMGIGITWILAANH